MQEQRPSIGSLLVLMIGGFIGIGVVGFVILVLVSVIGPWIMVLPLIVLAVLFGALWLRRRRADSRSSV